MVKKILQEFDIKERDVRQIPALTLAYLGDCIYELVIRTMLVEQGLSHVSELNKAASSRAKASAQAELLHRIEPLLSEEELAAYKRGRNVKSAGIAKHATVIDYRTATGFEALMGYLYVNDRLDRILELVKAGEPAAAEVTDGPKEQ